MNEIVQFGILSGATAAISATTALSNMPVLVGIRKLANKYSKNYIGGLLRCPYCVSHWVSFFMAFVFQPKLIDCGYPWLNYLISAFCMVTVSAYLVWAITKTVMSIEGPDGTEPRHE